MAGKRASIATVAGSVAAVAGAAAAVLALMPNDPQTSPTVNNSIRNFVNAPAAQAATEPSATVPTTTVPPPRVTRTFHTPSGNVSCTMDATGANCTVSSIQISFVLTLGARATIVAGAELGRGAGKLAGWGTMVVVGGITCKVPQETQQLGVVCFDDTGHGFEASRFAARRKAY